VFHTHMKDITLGLVGIIYKVGG